MFELNSLDFNALQTIWTFFALLVIYYFFRFWRNQTIVLNTENTIVNKKHLETNCDDIEKKYPNTWYPIIQSRDLKPGEIKPIYALEKDLVVYRSFSGKAYVLDAYCPHQGAHLGVGGSVVGEDIRCPFHSWTFSGSGVCTSVPGLEGSSLPKAQVKTWKCIEQGHFIYFWFHNQGLDPDWMPENYLECDQVQYCGQVSYYSFCHLKDIHGNLFDFVHLDTIHSLGGVVSNHQLLTKGKIYDFVIRFLRFKWVFESEIESNKTKKVVLSVTPVLFNISLDFLKTISKMTLTLPMTCGEIEIPWLKTSHYFMATFIPISHKKCKVNQIFYSKKFDIISKITAKISMKYFIINTYPELIILNNNKCLTQPYLTSLDKNQAGYYRWVAQFYK